MSTTVDNRVVEMRFDNRHFEKNVSTTMSSLDKLKKNLDMTESAKKFSSINREVQNVDFNGAVKASNSLGDSFSTLVKKAMAITIISDITRDLTSSIKGLANQFSTIASAKSGFSEYELKMGSIQTIMAGTGESLETVNKKLWELNEYSDKTIYSFADMTSNIGKFTNAGVKLEDAVNAIKGVSNVAAVSGANTNEASRAMYNFAQALSAGYVKLIDWKSIENANMATVEFKNQLIETAVSLGTVTKQADGMYRTLSGKTFDATHNFNDVLQEQWMTTDVLVKTLNKYADENTEIGKKAYAAAQDVKTFSQMIDTLKESMGSGWSETWEILVGDFEEAKKLFTGISEFVGGFIGKQSAARNQLLQGWKDLGGREALIEGIKNAFTALKNVIEPASKAFRDIFPKTTSDKLHSMTLAFKDFTEKFIITKGTAEKISRVFRGLFSTFKMVTSAVKSFIKPIFSLFTGMKSTNGFGSKIFDSLAKFGDWLTVLGQSGKVAEIFKAAGEIVASVISKIISFVGKAIDATKEFAKGVPAAVEAGANVVGGFTKGIQDKIKSVISIAVEFVKTFLQKIRDLLGIHSPSREMKKIASDTTDGFINGIKETIPEIAKTAKEMVVTFLKAIVEGFKKLPDKAKNAGASIKSFMEKIGLKDAFESLLNFLKPITDGIVTAVKTIYDAVIRWLGGAKFGDVLAAIRTVVGAKVGFSLANFLDVKSLKATFKSFEKIGGGIAEALDQVCGILKTYQQSLKAEAIMNIAKAILMIAGALVVLSFIPEDKLASGIMGISALFAELMLTMNTFTKLGESGKNAIKCSAIITSIANAVLILSISLLILSKVKNINQGIFGLAMVLGELVAAVSLMSKYKALDKEIKGIIAMAVGVYILSMSLKKLSKLPFKSMLGAAVGIGLILAELSIAMSYMSFNNALDKSAKGIIAMSVAVYIISMALKKLAKINFLTMLGAAVGIGLILAELSIAMSLMANNNALDKGVKGIIAMSLAIYIVSMALKKLSKIPFGNMLVATIAFVVIIEMMTKAMNTISKMPTSSKGIGGIMAIAASVMALALAFKFLSKLSLPELLTGLVALAGIFVIIGGAVALLSPLTPAIMSFATALFVLASAVFLVGATAYAIGKAIEMITNSVTTLSNTTQEEAETFGTTIQYILGQIAAGLAQAIVIFLSSFDEILFKLRETSIILVAVVLETLYQILVKIREYMPAIISIVLQVILDVLIAIRGQMIQITAVAVDIILAFIYGLNSRMDAIVQAAFDLIIAFINALANAIRNNSDAIFNACWNLVTAIGEALFKLIIFCRDKGIEIGKNIIFGIGEGLKSLVSWIGNGIKEIGTSIINGFKNFFGIHSPSKLMSDKVGKYLDLGLAKGIEDYAKYATAAGSGMAEDTLDSIQNGVSGANGLLNGIFDGDPTIRPVLDLSNVESGARSISNMLSREQALALSAEGSVGSSKNGALSPINITVYGAQGQDVKQLAEIVSEKINISIRKREKAWG